MFILIKTIKVKHYEQYINTLRVGDALSFSQCSMCLEIFRIFVSATFTSLEVDVLLRVMSSLFASIQGLNIVVFFTNEL